jgi:hypothetical protein
MLLPAPGRALHEQWCLPWPIVDTGTDNSRFASQIKPQNVRPNTEKTPFLGVSEWSVRDADHAIQAANRVAVFWKIVTPMN